VTLEHADSHEFDLLTCTMPIQRQSTNIVLQNELWNVIVLLTRSGWITRRVKTDTISYVEKLAWSYVYACDSWIGLLKTSHTCTLYNRPILQSPRISIVLHHYIAPERRLLTQTSGVGFAPASALLATLGSFAVMFYLYVKSEPYSRMCQAV
jgi:hypothetical protein